MSGMTTLIEYRTREINKSILFTFDRFRIAVDSLKKSTIMTLTPYLLQNYKGHLYTDKEQRGWSDWVWSN